MEQVGWEAQYRARVAQDQFQRMLSERPLAVGALAAAMGLAVGLAIPETPQENELMGKTREQLMERAS